MFRSEKGKDRKVNQKYKTEFQALFDAALMFAKRHFEKRLIPFTDVEDVTMEAVEEVLRANERGKFRHIRRRAMRWEVMKNKIEECIRDAPRARRTQKSMVSLQTFDSHVRETSRFDGDGTDSETEEGLLAAKERSETDGGAGAERIRDFGWSGVQTWPRLFKSTEVDLMHDPKPRKGMPTKDEIRAKRDKQDERNEYRRFKQKIGINAATPKEIPQARRVRAREGLRRRFRPVQMAYHRELAAELRREVPA